MQSWEGIVPFSSVSQPRGYPSGYPSGYPRPLNRALPDASLRAVDTFELPLLRTCPVSLQGAPTSPQRPSCALSSTWQTPSRSVAHHCLSYVQGIHIVPQQHSGHLPPSQMILVSPQQDAGYPPFLPSSLCSTQGIWHPFSDPHVPSEEDEQRLSQWPPCLLSSTRGIRHSFSDLLSQHHLGHPPLHQYSFWSLQITSDFPSKMLNYIEITSDFTLTNWNTVQSCDSTGPSIFYHKFPILDFSIVHSHFSPEWGFLPFFHSPFTTGFHFLFYKPITGVHHSFSSLPTMSSPLSVLFFSPWHWNNLFPVCSVISCEHPQSHPKLYFPPHGKKTHFILWILSGQTEFGSRLVAEALWLSVWVTACSTHRWPWNLCHFQDWRSQSTSSGHLMT